MSTLDAVLPVDPKVARRIPRVSGARGLRASSRPSRHASSWCRCAASALLGVSLTACVTVNIYFPAPEVREAAEKIVDETWGGSSAPAAAADPGPQSRLVSSIVLAALDLLSPASAEAAEPDINVSTPKIRAIKEAMTSRSAELKPYLASGSVGIGVDGMLVVRDAGTLELAAKAKVRRLVDAENKDRSALYKEIAAANNFAADRVGSIQKIFADTWIHKAESGWWVQSATGGWTRK